jgi:hypothetical protein
MATTPANIIQMEFDYGDLPRSDVSALEKHAKAITKTQEQVRRISAEGVIAIGRELKAAHELLAGKGRDGMFRPWVKARCEFTEKSARRAIAAFDVFGKKDNLSLLFDASSLYVLSSESCPEEATKEALKLAAKGEQITHKRAKEIKDKHCPKDEKDGEEVGFDFTSLADSVFDFGRGVMDRCPDDCKQALSKIFKQLSDEAVM